MAKQVRKDKTSILSIDQAHDKLSEVLPGAKPGRPVDEMKSKRVRYNTMLDDDLRRKIKVMAAQRDISTADIIDDALREYINRNDQ
jgi:hypothetical protein